MTYAGLVAQALPGLIFWIFFGLAVGQVIKRARKLGRAPLWPVVTFGLFGLLAAIGMSLPPR